MKVQDFVRATGCNFFAGVPDSLLKPLCNYLMAEYGVDYVHHAVCANEGNCVGMAAGYHLATGKVGCVYMQNSGQGNAVNPIASLISPDVYGIPVLFVIGWRGEPGTVDEPQHAQQGKVTVKLMELLGIDAYVIGADSDVSEVEEAMDGFKRRFETGCSAAFILRKEALSYDGSVAYGNQFTINREEAIKVVVAYSGNDQVVCTTGKPGRELFEIRERADGGHSNDFLTVGSMGHASSIAMGIAAQRRDTTVWCLDGDGAALMHMGAMAVLGSSGLSNIIHVVLNNCAHESVGGVPTVAGSIDLSASARACGYSKVIQVETIDELHIALKEARGAAGPVFIEVRCELGSRSDLGRPTVSPVLNKRAFMENLMRLPRK